MRERIETGPAVSDPGKAPQRPIPQSARTSAPVPAAPRRSRKRRLHLAALVLVPLLVVAVLLYYWFWVRPFESTDDAFIDGDVVPIAPQVSGRVAQLAVADNQHVNQSDTLVQIDRRDYEAQLAQTQAGLGAAHARLEQARAQVASDQAKVQQEQANLTVAETQAARAQADLQRYQSLQTPAVSRSEVDLALAQARSGQAGVEEARSRVKSAEALVALSQAAIQSAGAEEKRSEAAVQQAQLELSYTTVVAPLEGYVTHRAVQTGAFVQPGQVLMALVPVRLWVLANFKETQLAQMRPGQPVQIRVDAYPGHLFKGHIDSIQRGSGARFSLLPPENATGNYVKVVQRVPVKIVFDAQLDSLLPLGPGMTVVPKVRVLAAR